MKLTVFLIYVIIAVTTTTCHGQMSGEHIRRFLNFTAAEAMTCINNTHVKIEDLDAFDFRIVNDIPSISNLSLNVGCFFACFAQKREVMSGSRINLDELKRWGGQIVPTGQIEQEYREKIHEIYDNCENEVKSKVDECEVALKFLPCAIEKINQYLYSKYMAALSRA